MARRKYFLILSAIFVGEWLALAFRVHNRQDWALENALVILFAYPIARFYSKGYLSKTSLTFLFVFLSLHIVGAHYTYSLVPYDEWFQAATKSSLNSFLNWERNNYDRILHFLFGVLVFHPIYELLHAKTRLKRSLIITFTLLILFGLSTIYELIEWQAAAIFGGELGVAYVGAQGDPWDAQKDQACAAVGSILGLFISNFLRRKNIITPARSAS